MITFQGLGSGVQVGEIVDAIVNAEKVPFESRMNQQAALINADISAVGSLKSALEKVQESIADLADADKYQQRTTSEGDDFISLKASSDASVGSYSVKVDALAESHKLLSTGIDAFNNLDLSVTRPLSQQNFLLPQKVLPPRITLLLLGIA